MTWNIVADRPIYIQLVEQLKLAIVAGIYAAGDKMPTVRYLAAEAAVNANTMQRALTDLESSGLVVTQRTLGRFVTDDLNIIAQAKETIAADILREFIEKMKSLGYSANETANFIIKTIKE